MKIETALNYFSPERATISDSPGATSADRLSTSDVMAALAICQARSQLGVSIWLGKMGISQQAGDEVIRLLACYAGKTAPALLTKAAGSNVAQCMRILATFAWKEYARSAAVRQTCDVCLGRGVDVTQSGVKPATENAASPVTRCSALKSRRQSGNICAACHGRGTLSIRCRCNGRGRVKDIAASKRQGVRVEKLCIYCGGRGFRRLPSAQVFNAIRLKVPGLTQSSWSRNWKPLYQQLIAKCGAEAGLAAAEFRKITA